MLNGTLRAFTLIELLITIAIVGLLTTVAYPSYQNHVQRARRSDGQAALMDIANRLERFYTENNTYAGATLTNLNTGSTSPEGYYTITLTNLSATSYTVNAAPGGAQAGDSCGTLSVNQLGQKLPTGNTCWG